MNPTYQTAPSASDLMDTIRDSARNLSDAIRAANKAGISVSIMATPECKPGVDAPVFEIIYLY